MDVEALLASTQLASNVDVKELLSEDYDSSTEDPDVSLERSGDDALGSHSIAAASSSMVDDDDAFGTPSAVRALDGQLQGVVAQRSIELAELERQQRKDRRRDQETIRQLRDDNDALRRAAAAAQARAATELRTYRASVEAVHAKSRAELDELRKQQESLHSEIPAMRQRLAASKADFAQLQIDAPRYEVLRKLASEELSVVEHVQMRVFDLLAASERKLSSVLSVSGGATADTSGVAVSAQLQAEVAAREALGARLKESQARAEQKAAEAEEARSEARRLRSEAAQLSATPEAQVRVMLSQAESALAERKGAAEAAEGRLKEVKTELEGARRAAEESAARADYLAQDKEYLRVQLKTSEERQSALEIESAKHEASLAEARAEVAKLKEQILASTRGQAEEYAARLEAERLRWQSDAQTTQAAHAEAHQAAVNTYKDSRELALADSEKWQTR